MSLTVDAQGTRATVSDPDGIEHTHRPIMFGASLLWIERCPLPTTQGAERRVGESHVPQCFLFALHVPIAEARSDGPAGERLGDGRASV
jgi:hypothetical protein